MKKLFLSLLSLFILHTSLFSYSSSFSWLGSETPFKIDAVTDGILLGTGVTLNAAEIIMSKALNLNEKTFTTIPSKQNVNAFDRFFMNDYSKPIDITSDVFVGLAFASPLLFSLTNTKELPTVLIMYLETLLLTKGVVDNLKFFAGRTRPFMYYENYPAKFVDDGDWCKSWPSGHTSYTFATAAFLTYTFAKYNPDSIWKYVVSAASYSVAISVGAMRIASGCHFATDVLSGVVIGSAFGFLVPYLHTLKVGKDTSISVTPNAISFSTRL